MSRWRRYPKYKPSGVEWLGEVPEGWYSNKLKYLVRKKITDGPHDTPQFIISGYPFLSVDSIQDGKLIFDNCRYISKEDHVRYSKKCKPEKNDVLLGKAASTGKIARVVVDFEFSTWSPLALIKPNTKKIESIFLEYCLKSQYLQDEIDLHCSENTQKNIGMDQIENLHVFTPAINEQTIIAAFLDRETAYTETLIMKKERQIDVLLEKRAALVNHTVTMGIIPNVKMKKSTVEWILRIPEHWNEMRARDLYRQLFLPPKNDAGIVTVFRDGQVTLREKRRSEGFTNAILEVGYQSVRNGDLVIHSMDAFAGAIGVSDSDGKCTGEYVVCDPIRDDVNNHYYGILLRVMALEKYILAICPSVRERAPRFRFNTFKDVLLPVPPIKEQQEIVAYIEKETLNLDHIVERIRYSIDFLKEYRSALITAAVTGKIDVRKEVKAIS